MDLKLNFVLKTLKSEHFKKCNKESFALYLTILNDSRKVFTEKDLSEISGLQEMSILRHLLYLQTLGWIKFQKEKTQFQILLGEPNFLEVLIDSNVDVERKSPILAAIKSSIKPMDLINLYKNRYFQTYGQSYPLNIKKEMAHMSVLMVYAEKNMQLIADIINFVFDNHQKLRDTTWIKNRITLQSLTVANIWATITEAKAEGFKASVKDRFQETTTEDVGWQ